MAAGRLTDTDVRAVDNLMAGADAAARQRYPGDSGSRQPVHTVYVPADQVTADLPQRWGAEALRAIEENEVTAESMARICGVDPGATEAVWPRVLAKLRQEPVEDLRIDLEDGYRGHSDDDEDRDVVRAVNTLAAEAANGAAPPYWGIRFASLEAATRRRGLRTLDLAMGAALEHGPLPSGWVVTLPKVTSVEQVYAMVEACRRLERAYGLEDGRLRFELQVETPQAILGFDGRATVAEAIHASDGRCSGLHFGTYDYTAALGVPAAQQAMDHPAADHAKSVMALAAAGTGVRLSDGSTNVLPVGARADVEAGWGLHARLVRRSLERAYYQGWDLHPAQLPTRYLATYLFFRDGLDAVTGRLGAYLSGAGRAVPAERVSAQTSAGSGSAVLDEPATAQALAGFVLRGVRCGAVDPTEVTGKLGVELAVVEALARRRVG